VVNDKWTPLGNNLNLARIRWAEFEGVSDSRTFNAALDKYLASSDFSSLARNTQKSYISSADTLRKIFGKTPCKAITPAHIYEFMDKYPSKAVANVGLCVIKNSMERARRSGWIQVNPGNSIDRHKMKPRGRYLEDHEYQTIYQHASDILKAAMKIAYFTGARQIDVIKMRLSDITEAGVYIMQQKTKKKQLFMWNDELKDAIDQAKAITRPIRGMTLFCSDSGGVYSDHHLYKHWKAACLKAGVEDAQFRDLRSKSATDAENLGQDYQAILGHTSKAMSDRYVKKFKVDRVQPLRKKI